MTVVRRPPMRTRTAFLASTIVAGLNRRSMSVGLPDVVTVGTEGQVRYVQRIRSTLVDSMDLRDFPMDRQSLPLTLISYEYGLNELALSLDETAGSREADVSVPAGQAGFTDDCVSVVTGAAFRVPH
jgi:hypothetical protein